MYQPKKGHSIIKEQKLWKTGNSTVVTVPREVLDHFSVQSGDHLTFKISDDKVEVIRKEFSDSDILSLVDRTLERHEGVIKGLIDR